MCKRERLREGEEGREIERARDIAIEKVCERAREREREITRARERKFQPRIDQLNEANVLRIKSYQGLSDHAYPQLPLFSSHLF